GRENQNSQASIHSAMNSTVALIVLRTFYPPKFLYIGMTVVSQPCDTARLLRHNQPTIDPK
ncbi:MAG: hypothetical protein KAG34_03965, partial [Cocleimonas sp.]|nr:hypothetical protein [Cocleimonas sp.]